MPTPEVVNAKYGKVSPRVAVLLGVCLTKHEMHLTCIYSNCFHQCFYTNCCRFCSGKTWEEGST